MNRLLISGLLLLLCSGLTPARAECGNMLSVSGLKVWRVRCSRRCYWNNKRG